MTFQPNEAIVRAAEYVIKNDLESEDVGRTESEQLLLQAVLAYDEIIRALSNFDTSVFDYVIFNSE